MAREDRQKQQEVFQQVELPKITKRTIEEQRYSNSPSIDYPTMDIPTQENMMPRVQRIRNDGLSYFDLLQDQPDPVVQAKSFKGFVMRQTFDDNMFAAFANKKLSTLKTMERQLGIPSIGAAPQKLKNIKNKNKSKKGRGTWPGMQ